MVIERNRIHDCGELPSTNKDHGIYLSEARDAIVRDNWIYDNADRGVQQYSQVDGARITGNVIFNNGEGVNYSGGSNQIVEGNIIASSNLRWNVYAGSTGSPGDGRAAQQLRPRRQLRLQRQRRHRLLPTSSARPAT